MRRKLNLFVFTFYAIANITCLLFLSRIYIKNLNEKINLNTLKETLKTELSVYGPILDIIAHKNIKMRGQAFVVYESLESAQAAVKSLQSEFKILFDKPLQVSFAKTKSDAIVKRDSKDDESVFEKHKEQRLQVKQEKQPEFEKMKETGKTRGGKSKTGTKRKGQSEPGSKKRRTSVGGTSVVSSVVDDNLPPNKLLLLQNLPADVSSAQIDEIYSKYPGFIEVRLVAPRRLAFVEYETDDHAVVAKEDTQSLELGGNMVKVTYTKK